MTKFTLHRAMAARDILQLKDVVEKTGIARATISSIYNNKSNGISLWVLERLCKGLECTPGELLEYIPN
jgi:putative transcriptional regulator